MHMAADVLTERRAHELKQRQDFSSRQSHEGIPSSLLGKSCLIEIIYPTEPITVEKILDGKVRANEAA